MKDIPGKDNTLGVEIIQEHRICAIQLRSKMRRWSFVLGGATLGGNPSILRPIPALSCTERRVSEGFEIKTQPPSGGKAPSPGLG